MATLSPRNVSPKSWLGWLREGFDLATRRIWVSVPLCLAIFGAHALIPYPLDIVVMTLLAPVYLGMFVLLAQHTDRGGSVRTLLRQASPGLGRLALLNLVLYVTMTGVGSVGKFLAAVLPHDPAGAQVSTPVAAAPIVFADGAIATVCLGIWLGLTMVSWFATSLFAVADVPLVEGCKLAFTAYLKNQFILVFGLMMMPVVIVSLTVLQGFGCVVLYPFVGAVLYVSYRDVFLGLPPKKVTQKVKASNMAPASLRSR